MKKLRLLLWEDCNRSCEGCCNKDWDLKNLPVVESYDGYDEILLTGGEPMLYPEKLQKLIMKIGWENVNAKKYMYTADLSMPLQVIKTLTFLDGMTVTLHEQSDVDTFFKFNILLYAMNIDLSYKSLRLNIFKGVDVEPIEKNEVPLWHTSRNREWIKNCPLPKDEVFMRI